MAFPTDIGTGSQVFSEPFTYTDGAVSTRPSTQWGNPLYTGQASSTVVSNQLRVGPTTTGWNDCYTLTNTFGEGDFIFTLVAKPADTLSLITHVCAAREAESGVDSYSIFLSSIAGTDRIRLVRWSNGSIAETYIDVNQEFAAGDQFCVRREADTLALARKPAAGSWTQVGSTITGETDLTAGRLAFESNSGSCLIDDVAFHDLPVVAPEGALTVESDTLVTISAGIIGFRSDPFSDDFDRADGALGNGWDTSGGWVGYPAGEVVSGTINRLVSRWAAHYGESFAAGHQWIDVTVTALSSANSGFLDLCFDEGAQDGLGLDLQVVGGDLRVVPWWWGDGPLSSGVDILGFAAGDRLICWLDGTDIRVMAVTAAGGEVDVLTEDASASGLTTGQIGLGTNVTNGGWSFDNVTMGVSTIPVPGALAVSSDTLVTISGEIPPVEGALAVASGTVVTVAGAAIRVPYGRDLSGGFGSADGDRDSSGGFGAAGDDVRQAVGGFLP